MWELSWLTTASSLPEQWTHSTTTTTNLSDISNRQRQHGQQLNTLAAHVADADTDNTYNSHSDKHWTNEDVILNSKW